MIDITDYEYRFKTLRDELFQVHLNLELLAAKSGKPGYDEEIRKNREKLIELRHALAKLKREKLLSEQGEGRK